MSPKPTDAQKKANAANAVQAALAEGKITDQSLPAWRQAYERNPEATRAELRRLVAPKIYVPGSAGAPVGDKEARLLAGTRAALGLGPAPVSTTPSPPPPAGSARGAASGRASVQGAADFGLNRAASPKGRGIPAPGSVHPLGAQHGPEPTANAVRAFTPSSDPLSHSPSPQPVARPTGLTRTEHGNVLYGGVPTCMSDRGTRQVYYFEWLDIADFEQRGLQPEASAMAIQATQAGGTPESRATLAAGLPAGGALGVV
jgi:hypothetical protein